MVAIKENMEGILGNGNSYSIKMSVVDYKMGNNNRALDIEFTERDLDNYPVRVDTYGDVYNNNSYSVHDDFTIVKIRELLKIEDKYNLKLTKGICVV